MRRPAGYFAAAFLCGSLSACASPNGEVAVSAVAGNSTFGAIGKTTEAREPIHPAKPPSGFADYCVRNSSECRAPSNARGEVELTAKLWSTLQDVNIAVNKSIHPLDDSVHYGVTEFWTIPSDGYGDCDDYVLAKRKMLLLLGVPQPALRIAIVLTRGAVRHAVLTIVTDRGDYVLDNLHDDVLPQDGTNYTWIERQDPASSTGWKSLKLVADQ